MAAAKRYLFQEGICSGSPIDADHLGTAVWFARNGRLVHVHWMLGTLVSVGPLGEGQTACTYTPLPR